MRLLVPFLVFAVLVGGVKSQQEVNVAAPSPPASAPIGVANDEDENDSTPSQDNNNSNSNSSSSSAPANSTVAATPAAAPADVDNEGAPAATYAPTPLIETEIPTAAPFFYAPLECYDKLQIVHDMIKVQEPFMQHVYKLCPNTVFDIGTIDENHECCIQGDARLVPRKDTTIQCGEDGLSTNNCTLRGGPVQVISWDENYNLEAKTNTALKGLTFESTDQISILLMTGGEFLFEDCIFQVSVA
jgi:hypothetical protein